MHNNNKTASLLTYVHQLAGKDGGQQAQLAHYPAETKVGHLQRGQDSAIYDEGVEGCAAAGRASAAAADQGVYWYCLVAAAEGGEGLPTALPTVVSQARPLGLARKASNIPATAGRHRAEWAVGGMAANEHARAKLDQVAGPRSDGRRQRRRQPSLARRTSGRAATSPVVAGTRPGALRCRETRPGAPALAPALLLPLPASSDTNSGCDRRYASEMPTKRPDLLPAAVAPAACSSALQRATRSPRPQPAQNLKPPGSAEYHIIHASQRGWQGCIRSNVQAQVREQLQWCGRSLLVPPTTTSLSPSLQQLLLGIEEHVGLAVAHRLLVRCAHRYRVGSTVGAPHSTGARAGQARVHVASWPVETPPAHHHSAPTPLHHLKPVKTPPVPPSSCSSIQHPPHCATPYHSSLTCGDPGVITKVPAPIRGPHVRDIVAALQWEHAWGVEHPHNAPHCGRCGQQTAGVGRIMSHRC